MSDYQIVQLGNIVAAMREVVRPYFPMPKEANYLEMSDNNFRDLVALAQGALNDANYARRVVLSCVEEIASYLGSPYIMFQQNLYLRAARPGIPSDVVGYHRESFYGAPPGTVNFWVPLLNVTSANSLRYVPCSTLIPDSEIVLQSTAGAVERGSSGHQIGLLYAPKVIVGGVQLDAAQSMEVPDGHAALFSADLIHGAGLNLTGDIRFSIDLRLCARANAGYAKPGYFVEL